MHPAKRTRARLTSRVRPGCFISVVLGWSARIGVFSTLYRWFWCTLRSKHRICLIRLDKGWFLLFHCLLMDLPFPSAPGFLFSTSQMMRWLRLPLLSVDFLFNSFSSLPSHGLETLPLIFCLVTEGILFFRNVTNESVLKTHTSHIHREIPTTMYWFGPRKIGVWVDLGKMN